MDGWKVGRTDGRMDGLMDRWIDGWVDGWTDERMDGGTDGWMGHLLTIFKYFLISDLRIHFPVGTIIPEDLPRPCSGLLLEHLVHTDLILSLFVNIDLKWVGLNLAPIRI